MEKKIKKFHFFSLFINVFDKNFRIILDKFLKIKLLFYSNTKLIYSNTKNKKTEEIQINIDFTDFFNFYHFPFFSCVRDLKNCVRENKKQSIFP